MLKYVLGVAVFVSFCLSVTTVVFYSLVYNTSNKFPGDKISVSFEKGTIRYWSMTLNAISAVLLPLATYFRNSKKYTLPLVGVLTLLLAGLLYDSVTLYNENRGDDWQTLGNEACTQDGDVCHRMKNYISAMSFGVLASPVASALTAVLIFLKLRQ